MQEVKSVAEYVDYLDTLQEIYPMQRYVVPSTFFRGQSNKDWKLSPKLYREGLLEQEGLMIEEITHANPKEFELERFDVLTKLQHFGFPTRLLDVTSNPLVALYFILHVQIREKWNVMVRYILFLIYPLHGRMILLLT